MRAGLREADAEDVVQETLLAIHLKRHTWRDTERIGPWVRAIARNKLIDALRRRGRHVNVPIDDFIEVLAADEPRETAAVDEVERHLQELSSGQREVVRMIAIKGAAVGEVASELKMSPGAVRVALHRGLAALAQKCRSTD
jgi:RNA polymerase sigma-70 factor (ECF subfamily)